VFEDVPCLRRSVAGISPRRARFDPSSIHVRFVVDKWVLGQVSLRVILLHVALSSRANGRSVETFQKTALFRKWGSIWQKRTYGGAFDRKGLMGAHLTEKDLWGCIWQKRTYGGAFDRKGLTGEHLTEKDLWSSIWQKRTYGGAFDRKGLMEEHLTEKDLWWSIWQKRTYGGAFDRKGLSLCWSWDR
jgi:hypothetical protein